MVESNAARSSAGCILTDLFILIYFYFYIFYIYGGFYSYNFIYFIYFLFVVLVKDNQWGRGALPWLRHRRQGQGSRAISPLAGRSSLTPGWWQCWWCSCHRAPWAWWWHLCPARQSSCLGCTSLSPQSLEICMCLTFKRKGQADVGAVHLQCKATEHIWTQFCPEREKQKVNYVCKTCTHTDCKIEKKQKLKKNPEFKAPFLSRSHQ